MQSIDKVSDFQVDQLELELMFTHDPLTTDAERIQNIIDSNHSKADLEKVVLEVETLSILEQKELLKLLQQYEPLFDGTLGTWKTEPIELELKDPDCKPYHAKPYPVPHSQENC